ncbi:helix-turn-helix transcriptional regulator [Chitinophaga japonensis]|uniref:AraC-like DNA-binding protein n=1 Tax=Chitinophaga japonensis TaxID=104662 RepID=A0A562TCA3_CHIJA|nr:AraC family transcriptional regulator [Chitinophaga japonensis]TWI91125.1 AraC-like DNA-binding protein [Chitinophaga japonensis]
MMQYHVSGKMLAAITVRNDIPWQYQQHQLPSATHTEFTSGPFGAILSQVIANDDWTIQQVQFFITRPVRLYPVTGEPLGALHCMLTGSVPCVLKGFGNVLLQEKELYFFYVPAGTRNLAVFSKGYYDSFHISFTPGYLAGFTHNGSPLKNIYQQLQQGLATGGYAGSCALSLQAMEQVEKIRQCQLQGSRRKLYYQARINDLMLLYMAGLEDAGRDMATSGKYEKEMQQLASYVADNLEKPLTAALLAGKMGLPLQVTEREFRKLFQQTIRSYIHDQRMKRAKLLLAAGKMPVTDVAYTVGFADVAYFSNAFKKQFGITPTGYQQLHKHR